MAEHIPDPRSVSQNLTLHKTWLTPREIFPAKHTDININSLMWELEQSDVLNAILDVRLTPELPTGRKQPSTVVQVAWSPAGFLPLSRQEAAQYRGAGCLPGSFLSPGNHLPSHCHQHSVFLDMRLTVELLTGRKQPSTVVQVACRVSFLSPGRKQPSTVVQVAWSPAGFLPLSRCALATVSNHGSVALHEGNGLFWRELVNLSERYVDLCRDAWSKPSPLTQYKYQQHRKRTAQLVSTSVCWGALADGRALLACGQLCGDVLVWKVPAPPPGCPRLRPELLHTVAAETGLGKIECLAWCPLGDCAGLLLAGGYNGRVSSWRVREGEGGLECREQAVWPHEDRVAVQWLTPLPRPKPAVLAAKGTHLLLLLFDGGGAKLSALPRPVGGLEVTGVVVLDHRTALVATQSSRLSVLRLGDVRAGETSLTDLPLDKNTSHWSMCGLTASPSRKLFAVCCRLCKAYDHLVHRESAQICFLKQPENIDDLMSAILSNKDQKLTNFWEHLEVIRLQCVMDGCVPGVQFATEKHSLEEYTSYQLRVAIVVLNMVLAQTDSPDAIQLLRDRVQRMALMLLVRHVCTRMSRLARLAADKTQLASLGTMRLWLAALRTRSDLEGERTAELVSQACDLPSLAGELQEEFCHICCANILFSAATTLVGLFEVYCVCSSSVSPSDVIFQQEYGLLISSWVTLRLRIRYCLKPVKYENYRVEVNISQ
ncbi:uncharacterized protein LOC134540936 [Bacillus rossius redtenbacheri]|uniref:uncharacterized protein LOC134540936 n=1 Tax=Bacillus rossius redtenbacheri TaxID=93214 RepID=UPI002FDD0057